MSEEKSFYSEEGVALVAERIKTFFDLSTHYKWAGQLGQGANGMVYKILRRAGHNLRTLAVKIPPMDVDLEGNKSYDEDDGPGDEIESIINERNWLRSLRGSLHIINSLDLPDDPLAQTPGGVLPHRMTVWIFMEYVENGGLERLIERHRDQYEGETMPNRLLWRFFMCLVRGCLEMAYYNTMVDGRKLDLKTTSLDDLGRIEPGSLAHNDLTYKNIVVGKMMPDETPEHKDTPILKLIDFGEAGPRDPEADIFNRTGSQFNVFEICQIMACLILLDELNLSKVEVTINGQTFETVAGPIHQNQQNLVAAGIDVDLLHLVYRGLSTQTDARRITLIELAKFVLERVNNRGHNGDARETDEAIRQRVYSLIHHGDLQTRKRHADADADDDGRGRPKRRF